MKPFLITIGFLIFATSWSQDTIKTNIIIDSLDNEVLLIMNHDKKPIQYYSDIFTPVCVDGSCYPINVGIHWDLGGNYLKYTLSENEILTKVEHLPFSKFDYGLLHRMIEKSPSALANFSIYELTTESVDGVTGATRPELSGSFVPDALFTTYTLWHLVRRPSKAIKQFTADRFFTEDWIPYLMEHPELGSQRDLIQFLINDKSIALKVDLLFNLAENYSSVFPFQSFNYLPLSSYDNASSRKRLISFYTELEGEKMKKEIMRIWRGIKLSDDELFTLTAEIGSCSGCFSDELKLIDAYEVWPEAEYQLFYDKIKQERNMMRKSKMQKVLNRRSESFPKSFKKLLKKNPL